MSTKPPPDAAFTVILHPQERILEVHYPAKPTPDTFDAYDRDVRKAIERLGGTWDCLVDQTRLQALSPELTPRVAELNHWARGKGMQRTARVVSQSAIAELQSRRILRESGNEDVGRVYHSRDEAWKALTAK